MSRTSGRRAIGMGLIKQSTANLLDVAAGLRGELVELNKVMPQGMQVDIGFDSSVFVQDSIDRVFITILEAIALVVIVIFLFLRNWRATLVPLVTIPIALVGAVALMWGFGFSINTLTLLAFVLAIGLVVDDAIVMLENIYRYIEQGMEPIQAAFVGSKQIGFAIVAMTFTLAAVFTPIAFTEGKTGKLFTEFALTLAGAVVVSGFVALTLSAMLASRILHHEERHNALFNFGERVLQGTVESLPARAWRRPSIPPHRHRSDVARRRGVGAAVSQPAVGARADGGSRHRHGVRERTRRRHARLSQQLYEADRRDLQSDARTRAFDDDHGPADRQQHAVVYVAEAVGRTRAQLAAGRRRNDAATDGDSRHPRIRGDAAIARRVERRRARDPVRHPDVGIVRTARRIRRGDPPPPRQRPRAGECGHRSQAEQTRTQGRRESRQGRRGRRERRRDRPHARDDARRASGDALQTQRRAIQRQTAGRRREPPRPGRSDEHLRARRQRRDDSAIEPRDRARGRGAARVESLQQTARRAHHRIDRRRAYARTKCSRCSKPRRAT